MNMPEQREYVEVRALAQNIDLRDFHEKTAKQAEQRMQEVAAHYADTVFKQTRNALPLMSLAQLKALHNAINQLLRPHYE
jgi:hypothetical protein